MREPDGLEPGQLALPGVPWDAHSSFLRGPALAPRQIRATLRGDHLWRGTNAPAAILNYGRFQVHADGRVIGIPGYCGDVPLST